MSSASPVWKAYTLVQHEGWMKEALALAELALPQDVPVGALVLDTQGEVIGRGWNQRETKQTPTGHAELMAIEQAAKQLGTWRLNGCCLYVTLEPCPMCGTALKQTRLDFVVYGAADSLYGAAGSVYSLFPPQQSHGGVLAATCQQQLSQFFKQQRQ